MAPDRPELSPGQLLDLIFTDGNGDLALQLNEIDEYMSRIIFVQTIEELGNALKSYAHGPHP